MRRHLIAWRMFVIMLLLVLAANFVMANGQPGLSRTTAYAAGSSDNVALRSISGSRTRLNSAGGVALDASGNLYVSNIKNNSITVYAARRP